MYPNWQAAGSEAVAGLHAFNVSIVAALHKAGAGLLLGTDVMKPTMLPGLSLDRELENFAAAGMTPYEAIRSF